MKQTLLRLISLLLIFTTVTGQVQLKPLSLRGTLNNLKNGTKIYFLRLDSDQIDSTSISNGVFGFKGLIDEPTEAALVIESLNELENPKKRKILWIESGKIEINGNANNLGDCKVTGSKSDRDYNLYEDEVLKKKSGSNLDSISVKLEKAYAEKHSEAYKSAMSLYFIRKNIPLEQIRVIYSNFSTQVQSSLYGKKIAQFIQLNRELEIGNFAPDFKLPNIKGDSLSLSSLKGKYVLIEFWGGWCSPCRWQNKYLNKLYEQHGKDLELIGIGLDTKEAQAKAVKEDQIKWTNLYTDKQWESSIAFVYGVSSVPNNFLLDKTGRIVDRNLRFTETNGYLSYDSEQGKNKRMSDIITP